MLAFMNKWRSTWLLVTLTVLWCSIPIPAPALELITNNEFESGPPGLVIPGWTIFNQTGSSGIFSATNLFVTPFSNSPTVGPAAGSMYAVSDATFNGAHALYQNFTVPGPAISVFLDFDMFVNNWGSVFVVDPAGLDYNGGISPPPSTWNQHARVDILAAGSNPLSTTTGLLANYYLGAPTVIGGQPYPYTGYHFDITSLVGGGGTYMLRFANVENFYFLNLGVDNVSVDFQPVPLPIAFLLLGSGLIRLVGWKNVRRGYTKLRSNG